MSRANVEAVRAGIAAYNRGDVEALLAVYDPDVEFATLLLGNHHGKEALRALFEENRENLSGYGFELDEAIDAGDTVIAVARLLGAGRVSKIELGDLIAFSLTFRDGRCVRQQTFRNKAEALEAVGLRE
jgi:ketosteroid isomerase-like protein